MQSNFFDQSQDSTNQSAQADRPAKRVFLYDGQVFEDPGAEHGTQDVLNFLSQTYPELQNGTWNARSLPDGTEEITFVKVTGEKGSQQVSVFDLPSDRPLLPGPSTPRRIFLYDGQIFEDPGQEFSTQDVLNFLSQTYPELQNGTWNARTLPDGTEEITFVKVTGEKGAVSAGQIAQRLDTLQPTQLQALTLLDQIVTAEAEEELNATKLIVLGPNIEAALHQVERVSDESRRLLSRCLTLKAVPHPRVPLGF
jgi:PRTRC genetic system protein C